MFEKEPVSPENPLFGMENFVGSPHMAAHTDEAMNRNCSVAGMLGVLAAKGPNWSSGSRGPAGPDAEERMWRPWVEK